MEKIDRRKFTVKDRRFLTQLDKLVQGVTRTIESYHFGQSAEILYEFIWHTLADKYFEEYKQRLKQYDSAAYSILNQAFTTCLRMLHPFMPFITEEINSQLFGEKAQPLIVSPWPK